MNGEQNYQHQNMRFSTCAKEPQGSLSKVSGTRVSSAISEQTQDILNSIRQLESGSQSVTFLKKDDSKSVDEEVFDATADVKVLFSRVSMYFSPELRDRLFVQLDRLHDPNDWEEGDLPISALSFTTFLRWFYVSRPSKLPNFGMSSKGLMFSSWLANHNMDRLILEFLPSDRIKWFVTQQFEGEFDQSAGITGLDRIEAKLQSFDVDVWFKKKTD